MSENFVNLWEAPNLLLQKTPADEFVVTTKVRVAAKQEGNYGGLIMMGRDYSALVIKRVGEAFQLQQLTCIGADKNKKETVEVMADLQPTDKDKINYDPAIYEELYLQLTVHQGGKMTFAYSKNGKKFTAVGKEFTMKEGKWIGAKFGFVAEQPYGKGVVGFMDIDWVRISQVAK